MIQDLDIIDAVKKIGVVESDKNREKIIEAVKKVLQNAGIYETKKGRVREGQLAKYGSKICLLFQETDGIKLLPIFPGMQIEILMDGVWQLFEVTKDNKGKAKIEVDENMGIFGEFARVGMRLDGSGLPALKVNKVEEIEGGK